MWAMWRGSWSELRTSLFVDSALCLAALRIVVSFVVLISPELYVARHLARDQALLQFVPEGLGFVEGLRFTEPVVRGLQVVAISSCVTGILGYWSRSSMAVLTVSAFALFSLSQRVSLVLHDMHLLWMSALLALSPCGDAFALDAQRGRPRPSMRYGVPLFFARAFLGVVYFFPGLHKLLEAGPAWISSANLNAHLYAKWFESAQVPALRLDLMPALGTLSAAFVVGLELTFFAFAQWPRSRLVLALCGLLFHAATQHLMYIHFASLWACYVVLLPWHAVERFFPERAEEGSSDPACESVRAKLAVVVGSGVLIAASVQGLRGQTQAFPFACYPTFAHLQADTIPDLLMSSRDPRGNTHRFTGRERRVRSQSEWGRVWVLSGAYGHAPNAEALLDHAQRAARSSGIELLPGSTVRVFRAEFATAPELWGSPPRRLTPIMDLVVR